MLLLIADDQEGMPRKRLKVPFDDAEGLGKPVVYICRADVKTHFDTDQRHTLRWDLEQLDRNRS